MDDDFRRIDSDAAAIIEAENSQMDHTNLSQSSGVHIFLPTPPRNRRTWVVFHGRLPGIYDYGYASPFITESSACPLSRFSESISIQTQGFSDAFHQVFPDCDSAKAAWSTFTRDGIYPDYGRGPWVVYLGHKPGVCSKM